MIIKRKELIEKTATYDIESKIISKSSRKEKVVHSRAEIKYDSKGKPEKILGIINDITAINSFHFLIIVCSCNSQFMQ